jgi:DNA-binding MarR family transcriptional regulator
MASVSRTLPAAGGPGLSTEEVGNLAEALTFAQRALLSAANTLREEYRLGRRGPWIVGQLAKGHLRTQADVVKYYKVGRSIITDEMRPLLQAGLVATRRYEADSRQLELALTPLGETFNERLGDALTAVLEDRLPHYSRDEILFCVRLLNDLAGRGA